MGISRTSIQLLLAEAAQRPFSGSVATLGRQHIYFTWDEFQEFARSVSVAVPTQIVPTLHRESKLSSRGFASDDAILAGLGFSEAVRIDYANYEDVEELADLSLPETPTHLQNRFDVILDTGTMEHVFHTPNFLCQLHRMLKPGGRIVHFNPLANCVDHGFYMFSPTFFADYYKANCYSIHQLLVCRFTRKGDVNSPVELYDYLKRTQTSFEVGTLDDRVYYNWVIVQRTDVSTCGVIPQQSSYIAEWSSSESNTDVAEQGLVEPEGTKADRLLKLTARYGPVHSLAKWSIQTWRDVLNSYRKKNFFPLPQWRKYH